VSAGDAAIESLVERLAVALTARGAMLTTAESCTGGLVAAACTARVGSSAWFERGVVTYSNAAKSELLGVAPALIEEHGAVSAEVARAMAEGVLARSPAHFSVAITGVAGPGGGTAAKPVGTVWIATAERDAEGGSPTSAATLLEAAGDRAAVRASSVQRAVELLLARIDASAPGGSPPRR
jgi:nicotinamide-nucleotide amidase